MTTLFDRIITSTFLTTKHPLNRDKRTKNHSNSGALKAIPAGIEILNNSNSPWFISEEHVVGKKKKA